MASVVLSWGSTTPRGVIHYSDDLILNRRGGIEVTSILCSQNVWYPSRQKRRFKRLLVTMSWRRMRHRGELRRKWTCPRCIDEKKGRAKAALLDGEKGGGGA